MDSNFSKYKLFLRYFHISLISAFIKNYDPFHRSKFQSPNLGPHTSSSPLSKKKKSNSTRAEFHRWPPNEDNFTVVCRQGKGEGGDISSEGRRAAARSFATDSAAIGRGIKIEKRNLRPVVVIDIERVKKREGGRRGREKAGKCEA